MGSPEDFPGRILHLACIHDNPELLADILKGPERDNLNALDAAGRSTVYSAVSNRSTRCLRILLDEGADPNIQCDRYNGQTPLHQAALDGRLDLITILLEREANIMVRDNESHLPLDYARLMNHEDCANLLKDAHDTLNGELSRELEVQLRNVAECDISICDNLVAILDKEKVKIIVNTKLKEDRVSILYRACILQRAELVSWLIAHGADCTYDPTSNQTPLWAACRNECLEAARILLEKFPELIKVVTSQSVGNIHCLHLAAGHGLELLRLLMEWQYKEELLECHYTWDRKFCYKSPFDVNIANLIQWSPLYFSTASNKPELVKYLLEYETMGYPLLSSFGELSDLEISQANITEYIDQNQLCRNIRPIYVGQPAVDSTAPLHYAVRKGYMEVASILIDHRADINQVCDYQVSQTEFQKFTPLRFAVQSGDYPMTSFLLKHGVRDEDSRILGTCFLENNKEMVNFILKHKAHLDTQHRLALMPHSHPSTGSRKLTVDDVDGFAPFDHAVNINWHGVRLPGEVASDWICECSHFINPHLSREMSVHTITVIDVSSTGITSLPTLIFKLRHLIILNAQSNTLRDLPPSEGWKVPNLKEICLDKNCFVSIPEGLFSLPSLEKLSMCENNITSVQFSVWTAPKLMDLNLAHNKITSLCILSSGEAMVSGQAPETRRMFSQDDVFVKRDTVDKGMDRSSSMSSASQPKSVVVNHWSESLEVMEVFESTVNPDATLTNINLAHNLLHTVPMGLPCLAPKLQRLDLSHNNIHYMGSAELYPISLTYLNLSFNKLKKMVELEELESLSNGVKGPPTPGIKQCYSPYKRTHRRGASGSELNIPRNRSSSSSISSLTSLVGAQVCRHTTLRFDNLTNLNVSHNRLSDVTLSISSSSDQVDSDSISEKSRASSSDAGLLFPKLHNLDISHNEITEIPPIISEQSELNQLYLGYNLLKDLPPTMGLLRTLWNMELSGCPLEGPLAGLVEMKAKTADIIGFLNSVLKDSKPYASMKLMLVGQANIGKTTLLSELKKEVKNTNPFRGFTARVNNTPADSKAGDAHLSTVGVDIGDLTFDRSDKKGSRKVTFKTWDFGGQEEYYATHQYFLSKRSLYLVLYNLMDGENALDNIKQWLVNIQTRSPGAPVIIVGSHYDNFKKKRNWEQQLKTLTHLISSKFITISEPAMRGLPNVIDTIEVSSKTRYNIAKLASKIYDTAWALKAPGKNSTMALLEQRIPAIYIQLEEVVRRLSAERLASKKNPVLTTQQYRALVSEQIKFRDFDELNQATQFLHDNGVLLHYQDVALNDLYFLDPQWLCDMLAHVITIKEINRFVKSGIMKRESLHHLFGKSVIFQSDDLQTYIVSLLSKFELALVWDSEDLLLPSLLPSERECQGLDATVKVPMHKSSTIKRRITMNSLRLHRKSPRFSSTEFPDYVAEEGNSTFYVESENPPTLTNSLQSSVEIPSLENSYISSRAHESIRRVYFLSYIPSGFWPRLISRIYRDSEITVLTEFLFDIPAEYKDLLQDSSSRSWQCWKTGLSLQYITSDLLKVKQIDRELENDFVPYYKTQLLLASDHFIQQDVSSLNILEVEIPDNVVEIFHSDTHTVGQYYTRSDVRAKLLAKVVDHIEMLLEDWYPDLGERFIQNTRGEYLVQRLIICPVCLEKWHSHSSRHTAGAEPAESQDTATRSRVHSFVKKKASSAAAETALTLFSVEDILTKLYNQTSPSKCKEDHSLNIAKFAPDLVFGDIYTTVRLEDIGLGRLLGKGAYGDVYAGLLKRMSMRRNEIAVKMMQPHDPGENASESAQCRYQDCARKWNAELCRKVFTSYWNARQEINILNRIQHSNIVSLVGVLLQPLSLLLERAPSGCLQDTIEDYHRAGLKIPFTAIQKVIIQTAQALSYLHNEFKLIYRDLKAENVLVWSMPKPHINQTNYTVEVKLADFGVSRVVSDRTARGYGGTRGYMAPEIIEFFGKEEYTEKVDCYSFSSFIYELIALKRPFWHCDGNIESLVLAGKRPTVSNRELLFPTQMLDLMTMCWSHDPNLRPSADQILYIASQPQFSHLHEPIRTDASLEYVTSCCAMAKSPPIDMTMSMSALSIDSCFDTRGGAGYDMYMAGGIKKDGSWHGRLERLTYGANGEHIVTETCELPTGCHLIIACCGVESACWIVDSDSYIHVMPKSDGQRLEVRSFLAGSLGDSGRVKQLLYSEEAQRVFILTQKGILIEYHSMTLEKVSERRITTIECNCMVLVDNSLWIGQKDAYITVLPIHNLVSGCESVSDWMASDLSQTHTLNHFDPALTLVDTAFLVSDTDRRSVWSNVYPGADIFRWDVATRTKKLCCNIALVISHHEQDTTTPPPSTHLTTLVYHGSSILAGTTCGYLLVLNTVSFSPLLCVKPYEEAAYRTLYSIVPLPFLDKFLTVGVGYRNHLSTSDSSVVDDGNGEAFNGNMVRSRKPPIHVLSWFSNPSESM